MKKYNLSVSIMWGINILLMTIIIVFPKTEELFNKLYYVFLICLFVVPLVLNLMLAYEMTTLGYYDDVVLYVPSLACALMMMLTFIKFVETIKKEVIPQFIVILFTFVLFEFVTSYITVNNKSKRKYLISCLLMYIGLILFFFCAMILSYDHSVLW